MIKRTLFFGNPAYLRFKDEQLVITLAEASMLPEKDRTVTIPIEDIGVLVIEHPQITLTHLLMNALLENNVAIITCDPRICRRVCCSRRKETPLKPNDLPIRSMRPSLCGNSCGNKPSGKKF